jgi:DNA-binding NtrC family response regulator
VAHAWPGNLRALRHAVERAVILSEGPLLEAADFPLTTPRNGTQDRVVSEDNVPKLEAIERSTIGRALERHKGNVSRAAEALGLTRASLYRRMEKYGL